MLFLTVLFFPLALALQSKGKGDRDFFKKRGKKPLLKKSYAL
jgi:hypothetical protein